MSIATYTDTVQRYLLSGSLHPLFLCGDSLLALSDISDESIDFAMTSPPYWGHRQYARDGIGLELDHRDYIANLSAICAELLRVLKPTGSFWLNIGDSYQSKKLLGIPWRIALELMDKQGWILRNDVIWNKVKGGPDNSTDKLRNVYEHLFHFVKSARQYYYNADAIRSNPSTARVVNGAVVSATGVSGVRYKRQIELSTALSDAEKERALAALNAILADIQAGKLADFRMIIRGQQRATHSDSERVSGRARELGEKGFYFLKYHPQGASQAMSGTFSQRTPRTEPRISRPTRRTCARCPFWQPARRAASRSIRSAAREPPCWWPSTWGGSPSELTFRKNTSRWPASDAGCCSNGNQPTVSR